MMMMRMAAIGAMLLLSSVVQAHLYDAHDNIFTLDKPIATLRASAENNRAGSLGALAVAAAPTNDMFADRIMLADAAGSVTGNNTDATLENNEDNFGGGSNSVWWSWTLTTTASGATWYSVNTIGSAFDTYLAIWTGDTLTTLTQVAFSDNFGGTPQSFCAFEALSGQTYQIQVLGASITAYGATQLRWEPLRGPTNDMFAARTRIADAVNSTGGYNIGATFQDGEPGAQYGSNSVWWTWTAPLSSWYSFDTVGSTFDTHLALFQGQAVTALTAIAEGDGASNHVFWAGTGDTFQVQVQGATTAAFGLITLRWSIFVTNDMFANRIMLYDIIGSTTGHNVAATFEPDEPGATHGSNSVWWSWMAPYDGWFTFDTLNSAFDTSLAVFQGGVVTNLSLIAFNEDYSNSVRSLCAFRVAVGETYQIQVMGASNGAQGTIVLRWSPVSWYLETMVTNITDQLVLLAENGAALNQWNAHIQLVQTGTNAWNTVYFVATNYPYRPITIVDKNNQLLVNQQVLPDMTVDAQICDFNGMNVLVQTGAWQAIYITGVWQNTSGCLQLYAVKKAPLATHILCKKGEYFVRNATWSAQFMRNGVLVDLLVTNQEGLVWLQRTLKKVLWELPLAPGEIMYAFDNGLAVRRIIGDVDQQFAVTRKAKPLGTVTVPIPVSGVLYARGDDRGNILHWVREGLTNGPMTLVSCKNQQVFAGFEPVGFQDFDMCRYNGKQLWFSRGTVGMGLATQLRSYSVGRAPRLLGTAAVMGYVDGGLDGKLSYAYGVNSATTTVTGFSRKMEPTWSNSETGVFDDYFGRGIYSIYLSGTSTFEYKMFRGSWFYADHLYTK